MKNSSIMVRQILTLLVIIFLSVPTVIRSEEKPPFTQKYKKYELRLGPVMPGKHAPSNLWIEFDIIEDGMIFYPADWYTEMSVTVTKEETGESWCGYVTDMTPYIPFDGEEGTYTIDCTTSTGRTLTGGFEI